MGRRAPFSHRPLYFRTSKKNFALINIWEKTTPRSTFAQREKLAPPRRFASRRRDVRGPNAAPRTRSRQENQKIVKKNAEIRARGDCKIAGNFYNNTKEDVSPTLERPSRPFFFATPFY